MCSQTQTHTHTGKIGVFNTTFLLSSCLWRHLSLNYSRRKLPENRRGAELYELMNHTVDVNIIPPLQKKATHSSYKTIYHRATIKTACKICETDSVKTCEIGLDTRTSYLPLALQLLNGYWLLLNMYLSLS